MMGMRSLAFFAILPPMLVAWGGAGVAQGEEGSASKKEAALPLVYENDFEEGIDGWTMTDPKAWQHVNEEGNHALALVSISAYLPPVRSPHSIARISGLEVSEFALEADMKQTGREYGHRDLCVFFGYQDASHYYYVHLATTADDHANSIFLVNGEPRVSIAQERTDGTKWGKGYHRVRIERNPETGSIKVYFDDMATPVMRTVDKTFVSGGIGFGSFDDRGRVDNVKVWGKRAGSGESK